jgi:hypothetical protein
MLTLGPVARSAEITGYPSGAAGGLSYHQPPASLFAQPRETTVSAGTPTSSLPDAERATPFPRPINVNDRASIDS